MKFKNTRIIFIIIFALAILLMFSGFYTINKDLLKTSIVNQVDKIWNIELKSSTLDIDNTRISVTFNPNDETLEYYMDASNKGTFNAVLRNIDINNHVVGTSSVTNITYYFNDLFDISLINTDYNKELTVGSTLNVNNTNKYKLIITKKNNLSEDKLNFLNSIDETYLSINLEYEEAI